MKKYLLAALAIVSFSSLANTPITTENARSACIQFTKKITNENKNIVIEDVLVDKINQNSARCIISTKVTEGTGINVNSNANLY